VDLTWDLMELNLIIVMEFNRCK